MSVKPPVPPYFDMLIEGFRRGSVGRFVHLGHWEPPFPPAEAPAAAGEFEQAQARLNAVLLGMAELKSGQSLLDVGCGFGGTLETVNREFGDMVLAGLNIDLRQLDICRTIEAAKGNRMRWEQGDACRLPFPDRSFDRVLCIEAMFHFGSRRAFFAEAARVLKPGGMLVASDIVLDESVRRLEVPGFCIEAPVRDGYGPWPDFWGMDADHRALAAAAGLRSAGLVDATANTFPSHRFTAPSSADERRDPGDVAARAALMLRWLHRTRRLKYLYMRFERPA